MTDTDGGAADFTITNEPEGGQAPERLRRKPNADGVTFPRGFQMKGTGLWYQPPASARDDAPDPIWIAAPFLIAAETNDDAHQGFGLLLRWRDRTGHEHQWAMPLRMVHAEGNAIAAELQDAGLACGTSRRAHEGLKNFLGAVRSLRRVHCVNRAGWHVRTEQSGVRCCAYVLPNGSVFGADDNSLVLQSECTIKGQAFTASGTLQEWGENVAAYALGNDRFVLAISAGFAGPLLEVTSDPSGGVHLHGPSQTGKTTLVSASASVWGSGDPTRGQVRSWRATANGLEAVAAEYCDNTIPLDEVGQANAREAGDIVYMLANGTGKARMRPTGGRRATPAWRLLFISTGETTLATKMGEAGLRTHAGQEVRLLNVPADAGAGIGVFQDLHCAASAGAFADRLRAAAATYYGTAGPAFLEKLVRDRAADPERLADVLRKGREAFLAQNVPPDADGQVRSAAARFALIGLAGELARAYGVVPWPDGEAMRAAAACFAVWLAGRGGSGPAEDRQALEAVEAFLAAHGASRFERLSKDPDEPLPDEQRVINRAGYVRDGGREFLVFPTAWKEEVCKGLDPTRVAKVLRDKGFLIPDKNGIHLSQSVHIPGRARGRFYVVSGNILGHTT